MNTNHSNFLIPSSTAFVSLGPRGRSSTAKSFLRVRCGKGKKGTKNGTLAKLKEEDKRTGTSISEENGLRRVIKKEKKDRMALKKGRDGF